MQQLKIKPEFYLGNLDSNYYLFNSKENLLYNIDKLSYEVLQLIDRFPNEQIIELLKDYYSREEILEAIREIKIQVEGGILHNHHDFGEKEYFLEIDVNTLDKKPERVINLINFLNSAFYFHINFVKLSSLRQLKSAINIINEINTLISGTPKIVCYNFTVKPDIISKQKILFDFEKYNIGLSVLIEDNKDLKIFKKNEKKNINSMIIRGLNFEWNELVRYSLDTINKIDIDYKIIIKNIICKDKKQKDLEFNLLMDRMTKISQLFKEFSNINKSIIKIYPFYNGYYLLDNQEINNYPCMAGRQRFYINPEGVFPCSSLCTTGSQLDIKNSFINNLEQSKYYIPAIRSDNDCLNCWVKGFCGGLSKCMAAIKDIKRYYCKLQKHLGKLYLKVYREIKT